jgi:hypothetical protein
VFDFTSDLFFIFCTFNHPTYVNQTGPYNQKSKQPTSTENRKESYQPGGFVFAFPLDPRNLELCGRRGDSGRGTDHLSPLPFLA